MNEKIKVICNKKQLTKLANKKKWLHLGAHIKHTCPVYIKHTKHTGHFPQL